MFFVFLRMKLSATAMLCLQKASSLYCWNVMLVRRIILAYTDQAILLWIETGGARAPGVVGGESRNGADAHGAVLGWSPTQWLAAPSQRCGPLLHRIREGNVPRRPLPARMQTNFPLTSAATLHGNNRGAVDGGGCDDCSCNTADGP